MPLRYPGKGERTTNHTPFLQPPSGSTVASFNFWSQPVYKRANGTLYTPGIDGNTYADNPWDYVYLGVPLTQPNTPGLCDLVIDKGRQIDKKKSGGTDGARVTYHGMTLGMVTLKIRIWTPDQLQALSNLWTILFPPAYKGVPPAFDAQHPALSYNGIKSLQFYKGSGPLIDGRGIGTFTMEAVEFLKPGKKNATKTNEGSKGSLFDVGAQDYPTPGSDPKNTGP